MRIRYCAIVIACAALTACANAPEELREDLRFETVGQSPDAAIQRDIQILKGTLSGDALEASPYKPSSPAMRWQAAHNLGQRRSLAAYDALVARGVSEIADANQSVRRECVIALGKLDYSGPRDPLRVKLIPLLRDQLIGEGLSDGAKTFRETDPQVRYALLDTLISLGMPAGYDIETSLEGTMGYRDVASELHTIAVKFGSKEVLTSARNSLLHEAMLERALDGLRIVTGTTRAMFDAQRAISPTTDEFIAWWIERIKVMPLMESS
ncbi:MAG: hypothetical protein HUU29_07340 [Planctomycetaceae bacterium]|nr:hypothetical protein [Planctomycetaceae bacterium]